MTKKTLILLLVAAAFAACSTANGIPIDDAYYSPDIESPAPATTSKTAAPSSSSSQSSASSQSSSSSSSIEYLNVQDTTVTIRIK